MSNVDIDLTVPECVEISVDRPFITSSEELSIMELIVS